MSKEQIEEMAADIRLNMQIQPNLKEHASHQLARLMYNDGYRKQSEGEWKLGKSGCMYFCSVCNYAAHPREVDEWNFCPRCGEKMKG